ncbi:NAD(P)/FAD-dependent oxidoreductase [Bradyrhizobium vignae]|uniref:Putative Cytochrome C4 n=1 Tax=Bradyrhizobium vignae TaxID=1549949 RepID=A0A2U3Q9I7_9BRAD|nr:FAD-dependent oxidoreductase [Bradyrhizobium vignae]SPP98084.1 putative Cytochrome C4 [Bradyrhizobium vignae]
MTSESIDALVVGASVVGVTAALALQQRGFKVMLLDQYPVAQSCSFGNAGVIATGAFPLSAHYRLTDIPAIFLNRSSPAALDWASVARLLPWALQYATVTRRDTVWHNTAVIHGLCRSALQSYQLLLGAEMPPINRYGYLALHLDVSELDAAIRLNAIRNSLGSTAKTISGTDLVELEPAIAGLASGATFLEGAGHVTDPAAFVATLANVFAQRGGRLRCDRVERLETESDGQVFLRGARENYLSPLVVLATGARANRLLADCRHQIPLVSERGYHLELDVDRGFISRPTALPRFGVVLTPSPHGARIAGISHFGCPDFQEQPRLLLSALNRLRRLLPILRPRPGLEVCSGERPTTPDSLPVVEQVLGHRSVFVSSGDGHLGLTLAPVTAGVVADMVIGISSNYSRELGSCRFWRSEESWQRLRKTSMTGVGGPSCALEGLLKDLAVACSSPAPH